MLAYALQLKQMHLTIIIFIALTFFKQAYSFKYSCLEATKKYELVYDLPKNLLLSMSLIESGRKLNSGEFVSWPWTINVRGKGKFFNDKKSAISFVKNYISKGRKNIDIGCMQINYMYHPKAFSNFDEAFDPEINVKRSAELLKRLYKKFGSWKKAVGYYHSYRTSKRVKYSSKVFNKWLDIKSNGLYDYVSEKPLKLAKVSVNNKIKVNVNPNKKNIIYSLDSLAPLRNQKENSQEKYAQNPYLNARMEKIKFFRNYFSQTINN